MAGYGQGGGYGNYGSQSRGNYGGGGVGNYGGGRGNNGGQRQSGGGLEGFDASRPYTSRLEACGNYTMRFGKYKDARLGDLADDDEALLYLDWLRSKEDFTGMSRDMVTIFLHQPSIAERLDAAIVAKRAGLANQR